jgi:hypothetical protein
MDDCIVLNARRLAEYSRNVSQVMDEGHPMWLKPDKKVQAKDTRNIPASSLGSMPHHYPGFIIVNSGGEFRGWKRKGSYGGTRRISS